VQLRHRLQDSGAYLRPGTGALGLDNLIPFVYNVGMGYAPGLQWNQNQLKIAKLMVEDKLSIAQICAKGFSSITAKRVKKHIKEGNPLPDLSQAAIDSAPPPMKIGQTGPQNPAGHEKPAGEDPQVTPKTSVTDNPTEAQTLKLISKVMSLPMTVDIFISYACARARGFPGDIGEWIGASGIDYWYGRGINPFEVVSGRVIETGELTPTKVE